MNDLTLPSADPMPGGGALSVETASSAVAAQAAALVQARYIAAWRRPRDWDVFREKMLKDCRRPSFAAVARYVKPIGSDKSKWPKGPSIRFAEAAIRNMTNVTVESMVVFENREQRIVRVTVTDLEANVPYFKDVSIAKTIERRRAKEGDTVLRTRTNSFGDTLYILEATDDDILNKANALESKALRTLALRIVPGDIVDECMDAVVATQNRQDAEDPDAARRKLLDGFAALGVTPAQVKEYLGHEGSTLNPKEIAELRGIYAALRDGETTWRDVMEAREGESELKKGAKTSVEELTRAAAERAAARKAAAGTAKSNADPATGETTPPPATAAEPKTFAMIVDHIKTAPGREEALAFVTELGRDLPDDQQDELLEVVERTWPPRDTQTASMFQDDPT